MTSPGQPQAITWTNADLLSISRGNIPVKFESKTHFCIEKTLDNSYLWYLVQTSKC